MTHRDRWAAWLLDRRQAGSGEEYERVREKLRPIRDRVIGNAQIEPGDRVLDVGTGDGLIGLEALNYGADVIFSDVSQELLDYCRDFARDLGMLDRCEFVQAPANDLSPIADGAVDVVTMRSVLIYVEQKQQAFDEFHRVLHTGGRLSLFEPINRLETPDRLWGYDVAPVQELAAKVKAVFGYDADDPMFDFDERDLIAMAERAGFGVVRLELESEVIRLTQPPGTDAWERFISVAHNPNAPSMAEAMQQALTAQERTHLSDHLRPLVRTGQRVGRSSVAYLQAFKIT